MASREAQGWQISVIIFAILTVLLAVTTYIYYRQSETYFKDAEVAKKSKQDTDKLNRELEYKLQAHKHVLGLADRDAVTAAQTAAGAEDPAVKELLEKFDADMKMFPSAQGNLNYRTLQDQLLIAVRDRNTQVVDAQARERNLERDKATITTTAQQTVEAAKKGQDAATADLEAERQKYNDGRTQFEKKEAALAGQLAVKDKTAKEELGKVVKEKEQLQAANQQYVQAVDALKVRKQELEADTGDNFENPDGKIQWVNQRQRLVWINLGLADGLGRQTTFAVFDRDQAGVKNASPKGRIEVLQIKDAHTAECRILQDKVADPIVPGDLIHTPAWQPGQKVRFALVGVMDLNNDGVSDRELIKNVIAMNGGLVDAELRDDGKRVGAITVNTRYVVLGDKPTDKTDNKILDEYAKLVSEAQRFGVETISVQKLLNLMGWKVEEKTLNLAKTRDVNKFKNGEKKPAEAAPTEEAAAPAAAPAKAPAAAPVEDDPFK